MKQIIIPGVISLMMILAVTAYSQNVPGAVNGKVNLKVIVDGFKNDQGVAKIGLCNSKETFKNSEEKAIISSTTRIVNGKAEYLFQGVPRGNYAVSVYHDENGNGKLDKGLFSKPLELYGFSNNARGIFSRPEYEKAALMLDKPDMTVTIRVE